MSEAHSGLLRDTLALIAPGTVLRDGLKRILRGRTGAIIVLGFDETVESISSGGFNLDVELSAFRLFRFLYIASEVCLPYSPGLRPNLH